MNTAAPSALALALVTTAAAFGPTGCASVPPAATGVSYVRAPGQPTLTEPSTMTSQGYAARASARLAQPVALPPTGYAAPATTPPRQNIAPTPMPVSRPAPMMPGTAGRTGATVRSAPADVGYPQGGASGAGSMAAPSPSAPPAVIGTLSAGAGSAVAEREQPAADEPSPAFRPGLATQWGETRSSEMSYAPFVRGTAEPFDTAAIFYNDAEGAAQQAAYHAATQPVSFAGAYNNGVRVSLRDENGAALQGYFASDRLYVMGHSGQRYTILIENTTPARFETVVSVDGLDVINGQPATPANRGYILQAYGTLTIDGFRQDTSTVASFRFGSVGESYAAQTGSARNVGVIGVALFAERGAVLRPADGGEVQLRETANPFPGQFATPPARRSY